AAQAGDDERFPRTPKPSIVLDEAGHAAGRERRHTIDERQMNADAERRTKSSVTNRIRCGRRVREQTCAGEHAAIVSLENAVVDAPGETKVICIDDQVPKHAYLPRMWNTCAARTGPA